MNVNESKSDVVLLARLKQVARLWVTQLEQEEAYDHPASQSQIVELLLKILQEEDDQPPMMIAKDARDGMVVTLQYWYDLIRLRRNFQKQMVLQSEQECDQNLNHWLQYCVGKNDREMTTSSPVAVAHFEPHDSPKRLGVAVSPGGDTRTSSTTNGTTCAARLSHMDDMALEAEAAIATEAAVFKTANEVPPEEPEENLKPAAKQSVEDRMARSHNTLVALYHGKHCKHVQNRKNGKCQIFRHCSKARNLWKHVSKCSVGNDCQYEHCPQSQSIMQHYLGCQRPSCMMCGPVLMVLPRLKADIEMAANKRKMQPKRKRKDDELLFAAAL